MFLDLKAVFDSVDREAVFHCMLAQGVPQNTSIFLKLSILTLREELEFTGN